MSREIKFRALVTVGWYGLGLPPDDATTKKVTCEVKAIYLSTNKVRVSVPFENKKGKRSLDFDLDEVKLMQFTGLLDKNGVDIYEGDIISVTTNHIADLAPKKPKTTSVVEVKFERAMFMFGDMTMNYYPLREAELDVIGNVWENPELQAQLGEKK